MVLEDAMPIVLDATVVRSDPAGPKHRVGLSFNHIDDEASHVITRFINKRMTALRSRGLS